MLTNCPKCQQELQFNEAQRAKIVQVLENLTPGKSLTIKCPHCQTAIKMGADAPESVPDDGLQPPAPPALEWLKSGIFEGEEKVEDVPMALVLFADTAQRENVVEAMKSVGYQVVAVDTAREAIERMRFVAFSCVALHTELEKGLFQSTFHEYMRKMPMDRRRYIFYIVVGPALQSLYDLEALALSANLVVGEKDLQYFDVILRKTIPAYEELFGPMLEELANYGKR